MTGLCLVAGLLVAQFGDDISLRWTHSIQKTLWEEDYRREGDSLRLVEARVRATGAGMEVPDGAVLKDGAWHYVPAHAVLPRLELRHSPHVPAHIVCSGSDCRPVDAWLPGLPPDAVIELSPCR